MIASGSLPRSRRALIAALAAALLTALMLLLPLTAASAHDELVASDPAAGATVDALPEAITLTYSAELLSSGSSTVVEVVAADGTSLAAGAPSVVGAVVTQPLTGTANGAVTVTWRVVSSDGHPISGEFAFDVVGAAPTETPTAAPTAVPAPSETATPEPTTTTLAVDDDRDADAADPLPWVLGAVALLAVIVLVVWLLGARARQQKQIARDRTAGRDDLHER